jgi:ribosomal protein S18 acetylase RimI-like enzyme
MSDQVANISPALNEPRYSVRPARPTDAPDLAAFLAESEPMVAPALGVPVLANEPENPLFSDELGRWVWVARRRDQETGALAGAVTLQRIEQSKAQMSGLRVAPELRGHGIGTLLVKESLRFCGDNGFIKVLLDTLTDQTMAIQLFERVGFQLSRKKQSRGHDCLEFYLDLYRRPDSAGE